MKLIDEKKFLEDIGMIFVPKTEDVLKRLLSKHLKDLPKKELEFKPVKNTRYDTLEVRNLNERSKGYNQCIEDCGDKNGKKKDTAQR